MTNLTILNVKPANSEEWDFIWKNCDYATYFHSREWAVVWCQYTRGRIRPDAKIVLFSDGKKALLPFSVQRVMRGLARQYVSSPAGTYGGWISLDGISEQHTVLLCKYVMSQYQDLVWRLNPYDAAMSKEQLNVFMEDKTHVLNLEQGFDVISKNWTKGHDRAVRKALKAGVEVQEAVSVEDWKAYYFMYEDSQKRWGKTVSSHYEWSLFQKMYDLNSINIKLWLAIYQNRLVAGALCFYAKKNAVYWHGAALSDYFNLRPVNMLFYEIIKAATEQGYQRFDFNPSGGHEGTERFKSSLGALVLECPVVIRESRFFRFAEKATTLARTIC